MKSINKIILSNVKTIFETTYFKMSLILMLVLSIYGGYLSAGFNYLEGFISILSFPIFFTFAVLVPFLVITFCTCNYFDKNEYLISRLTSRKEYLKTLILTVFVVNLFVYIIMLIIIIIALNLFPKAGIGFKFNDLLNCHNFIYLIFIIVRLFCIIQSISIFNTLLCRIINSKIIVGMNMILYGSFIAFSYLNVDKITSILNIPLYIGNYLIISKYDNFFIEFCCTTIYISILVLINYLLSIFVTKKLGDIKI